MRSAALLILLVFACKPIPLDLGDEPDSASTFDDPEGETTLATSGPITSSSDGASDTGAVMLEPGSSCDPANPKCSEGAICCSEDPATVGGKTPNYFKNGLNDEEYGTPIFSADNNDLGNYGMCIVVGEFATPLANGCAVPCNPTWDAERVSEFCGVASTCCQRLELDPDKDCVIDPMTERWRAVTGHDIGTPLTNWGDQHATNQDPAGKGCSIFANAGGVLDEQALADCYAQLTVADQRGFCQAVGSCPCVEDACDMKNPGWVPRCP